MPPVTRKRPKKTPSSTEKAKNRPRGRKAAPGLELFSRDVITAGGRKTIGDRNYQVEAIQKCGLGLHDGGRGQLISPCGTGKTVMCQRIAELLCAPGGVVVIACPSIALILQTLREWGLTNRDHVALAVCGDDSAADDAVTVADLPSSVTTSPAQVAGWLAHPTGAAIRLIVTTHFSAHVVGEALRRADTVAELLIVDEAHRSAGLADKHTALVHHDEHLAARRRLYTTATPRIVGARGEDDAGGKIGMDDEEIFGPVLFEYTFADGIADGYLDDYRLVVMGVTRREILENLSSLPRDAVASLDSPTGLHTAMVQTVLARAAAEFDLRRVLTFCRRVPESAEFARTMARTLSALPAELRPARPLYAAHVDGTMTLAARGKILDRLVNPPRDGWAVVSSCRCLGEGVDVPSVDAVAFTAPKQSIIDIIQAIGRALRRNPDGSGVATILVPILMPDDPDDVDETDFADYKLLWQVIRALRSHDSVLGHTLNRRRADSIYNNSSPQPLEQIVVDLPEGYDDGAFLRYLTARIISTTTTRWWDGYGHLKTYYDQHGHSHVGGDYVINDGTEGRFGLGAWADRARAAHRRGDLASDRVEALIELGFDFGPEAVAWNAGIRAARTFHAKYGHLEPVRSLRVDGVELRAWLDKQRSQGAAELGPDRAAQLDALGMRWSDEPRTFDEHVAVLRAHHAEHGNIDIEPDPATPEGRLGEWLIHVRILRKARKLAEAQVETLTELGMQWAPPAPPPVPMPQFSAPLS